MPVVLFLSLLDQMGSNQYSNSMLKYIALGASDSVGVGTSQPSKDGWVPKFASLINAQQLVNLGQSGSTLANAMREQLPKVFDQKPNVVTIWLAVNDFNQQIFNPSILTDYRSDLNKMLSQLRTKLNQNTRILVGNIPDLSQVSIYTSFGIPKQLLGMQIKQWNDAIDDIVDRNQCELVDLFAHWKELALHPEYISFDGFHPSANGYTRLAEIFYQQYSKK
jgi:lysophospholipase L1-like esterase